MVISFQITRIAKLRLAHKEKNNWTLMKFTGTDLSGLLKGGTEIKDKAAILDVPVGKGRVVMFTTNPCYRWQNHGEFSMLFNAILHSTKPVWLAVYPPRQ